MTRLIVVLMAVAAIFLAVGLPGERMAQATHNKARAGAVPLLTCSDVNGNGVVELPGDIYTIATKFDSTYPDPNYHLLYEVGAVNGVVDLPGDIFTAALDFDLTCPAIDSQIAAATRAIIDPAYSHVWCDDVDAPLYTTPTNCGGSASFLTENTAFLAGKGYLRGSTDVQGQGIHYTNIALWDGVFNPARPEGLVYNNGRLAANLYYSDGGVVGWNCSPGTGPPPGCDTSTVPADQVNIDPFASCAVAPSGSCSWAGTEDGWHWHKWLCTVKVGTSSALAIPGEAAGITGYPNPPVDSEAECTGAFATYMGSSGSQTRWDEDAGWMGHMWNHARNRPDPDGPPLTLADFWGSNPNGRLADCAPDETFAWSGFNCPQ